MGQMLEGTGEHPETQKSIHSSMHIIPPRPIRVEHRCAASALLRCNCSVHGMRSLRFAVGRCVVLDLHVKAGLRLVLSMPQVLGLWS